MPESAALETYTAGPLPDPDDGACHMCYVRVRFICYPLAGRREIPYPSLLPRRRESCGRGLLGSHCHSPHDLVNALTVGPVVLGAKGPVPPFGHDCVVEKRKDMRHMRWDHDEVSRFVAAHDVSTGFSRCHGHTPSEDHVKLPRGMHIAATQHARFGDQYVEAKAANAQIVHRAAHIRMCGRHRNLAMPCGRRVSLHGDCGHHALQRALAGRRMRPSAEHEAHDAGSGGIGQLA